ncbi:UNVERIFIED_CONTAM: hypothetical protein Sradi_6673600 [Sesamum radiatum]|uniref:Chromo domain-containing protein n=1 Tax=Sesamum radiatum TaxID=300843 RepID=A0AAW2JRH7_SESRA
MDQVISLAEYWQTPVQVRKNLKLAPKTHPIKILARMMMPRNNAPVAQILIQWEGFEEDQATWEDYYQIQKQFPDFELSPRDQGSQKERKNVTFTTAEISRLKMDRRIRSEGAKSNYTMNGIQFGRTIADGVV